MKFLSYGKLSHFITKILEYSMPTEYNYYLATTSSSGYSIPNYSTTKSLIEIYLNGSRLVPNVHYAISSNGTLVLASEYDANNTLHIVHKLYK